MGGPGSPSPLNSSTAPEVDKHLLRKPPTCRLGWTPLCLWRVPEKPKYGTIKPPENDFITAAYTAFLPILLCFCWSENKIDNPTEHSHVNDVFYFMFRPAIGCKCLKMTKKSIAIFSFFWHTMQNPWCLRYIGRIKESVSIKCAVSHLLTYSHLKQTKHIQRWNRTYMRSLMG